MPNFLFAFLPFKNTFNRHLIYFVLSLSFIFFYTLSTKAQGINQFVDLSFYESYKWRNIGPNRGGRSLSSTGSPGRINEYYFGATGGGLWKTVDGGNEWFPVTDGQIKSSSIGAVAVAETNPDIVYIAVSYTHLTLPTIYSV